MKIDFGTPEDESTGVAISITPESDLEDAVTSHVANTLVQSLRNGVRLKLELDESPSSRFQANPALVGTEFDFDAVDHDEEEGRYDEDGFLDLTHTLNLGAEEREEAPA